MQPRGTSWLQPGPKALSESRGQGLSPPSGIQPFQSRKNWGVNLASKKLLGDKLPPPPGPHIQPFIIS